jgi:hypothetical protein
VSSVDEVPDFTVPPGFSPPAWLDATERKHIPNPNRGWEEVIDSTAGREGDAMYHPRIPLEEIEQIEMATVRDMYEIESKRKPHQRVYSRHIGRVIGASKGNMTEYVYVFYNQQGGVHGLPITPDELRRKGVKI